MNNQPRPNINLDSEYLETVASLIPTKTEFQEIHFEYLPQALEAIGVTDDLYVLYGKSYGGSSNLLDLCIEKIFERVATGILDQLTLEKWYALWDYLADSDVVTQAELIYVFGGISELAVLEAIRLKKEGYAPKILFSGKRASYQGDQDNLLSEAERYAAHALTSGVAIEDILIEKESINTPENVVNSAKLLHSLNFLPKKVIAVSLPYHMLRASLTLRAGFDWNVEIIRHPGKSAKYTRENYFKDKKGLSYVIFEYLKLHGARSMKHF